jgi:two-component system chemotaxis response regulator CheY
MILEHAGHRVHEAEDGEEAFRYLQDQHADIAIVDIVMPEMTGIELLKKMKADPMLAAVPTIVCTSISEQELVQEVLSLGIAGYVLKPVTAKKLTQKIRDVETHIPPVFHDPARTRHDLGLDIEEYRKLLLMMIDDAKEKLVDIGRQVESGDLSEFRRFISDLTNSANNLGVTALEHTARDAGNAIPTVEPEVQEKYFFKLRSEIERLREAIDTKL